MFRLQDLFSTSHLRSAAVAGSAASTPTALALPEVREPVDWAGLWIELLKLEGLEPQLDKDGDIVFKYQRWTMLLLKDKRDSEYFRLALPSFWALDDERERGRAQRAADLVNRRLKVAKLHSGNGTSMWCSAEFFVADQRQVRPVLMRLVELLPEAVAMFNAAMLTLAE